jgi:hypothetical protein
MLVVNHNFCNREASTRRLFGSCDLPMKKGSVLEEEEPWVLSPLAQCRRYFLVGAGGGVAGAVAAGAGASGTGDVVAPVGAGVSGTGAFPAGAGAVGAG